MVSSQGLGSVLQIARAGIQKTHEQAHAAAENILASTVPENTDQQGDRVTLGGSVAGSLGRAERPGVVSSMIDLRVARYQQTAMLGVARTALEMTEEVLGIGKS